MAGENDVEAVQSHQSECVKRRKKNFQKLLQREFLDSTYAQSSRVFFIAALAALTALRIAPEPKRA